MPLFRVNVEVDLVIVAKDRRDAEQQAEYIVSIEDDGAEVSASATLLHSAAHLPSGWDPGALPFGTKDDKTIGEYLAECPSGGSDE